MFHREGSGLGTPFSSVGSECAPAHNSTQPGRCGSAVVAEEFSKPVINVCFSTSAFIPGNKLLLGKLPRP